MPVTLPAPIADYFAADRKGDDAIARCFTENAVVKDEGRSIVGHEAIRRWKAESHAKYNYVSEPLAIEPDGDRSIVTSRVTGNFPGSPVELRYAFSLAGDRIAGLEIVA